MKRWTLAGLFALALSLFLSEAHGDLIGPRRPGLPPPQPRFKAGPIAAKLVVKVDEKAKTPVLQVPINLALGQPQARPGFGQAPEPELENGRRFGLPTVVAGLALTLAFASGGLWMVRRGSGRTLVLVGAASLIAACTAAVWANGAPPAYFRRPAAPPAKPELTTLKLPAGIELTDKILLEPVAAADHLTLIVPKSMVVDKDKEKEASREKRSR